MTVYYGDLDTGLGIDSGLVDFRVENVSGPVVSSYYSQTGGFYVVQIDADQFGLGLQTFTVYADWTGPVAKYQNKSFVTTANVLAENTDISVYLSVLEMLNANDVVSAKERIQQMLYLRIMEPPVWELVDPPVRWVLEEQRMELLRRIKEYHEEHKDEIDMNQPGNRQAVRQFEDSIQ